MSDIAIQVEELGKQYQIGEAQGRDQTFREAILQAASAPVRLVKGERQDPITIWALKNVSFEVKQGEVIGIIGPNGAGKSTLLKILSRITKPTRGRIELNGRVGSLLEVGTGFHPDLTGRENVFLNGAILGMTRREIQRKFDEIIDFSGVEKFIDTPVKHYSGGMQVRLAFSVAAHLEPEILLVDEVLAVGDADFQKKCLGKMNEVSKTGRTVLFVSHNMGAIQELCQRVLLIESGKILKDSDQVKSVLEEYLGNLSFSQRNQANLLNVPRENEQSTHILLKSCTILNSNLKPSLNLLYGEPFSIQVEIETNELLENLSLFIGIDTASSARITTIKSDDVDKNFTILPGHPLLVRIDFSSLTLYPGDYLVTLAIRQGQVQLDKLRHVMRFRILEISFQNKKPYTYRGGIVDTKTIWEENDK